MTTRKLTGARKARPDSHAMRKTARKESEGLGIHLDLSLSNPLALIKEIQHGLSVSVFDQLANALDVSTLQLAQGVVISERTLARRKIEGRLHVDESDRVVRLALLFNEAVKLFGGDVGRAASWFHAPNTALGGAAPFAYADTEPGAHEVRDLIGRITHGVYS